MRLLVLAPNPTTAAATRFRLEQFFPALRQAGIEPVLRPFLDEEGFQVLYHPGAPAAKLRAGLKALLGRASDLVRAVAADAVLIHREAALVGPPLIEWLLTRALDRPVIFDLDDAVWVPYASPTYGALLSKLLKAPGKTHFTLGAAAHVIAGNPFVADYARRFNIRTDVVPTVVDTDRFVPSPTETRATPVLGWIGTHSSLQYLQALVPALTKLAQRRKFVLRVVGATLDAPGLPVENVPWSLEREVSDFQGIDIGLYPLVEDAWSLGKSGFKAVQYMACAVPMVVSPVGVTLDMVRDGDNGFLAYDDHDWVQRLEQLLDSPLLRRALGENGRAQAVERWSLAAYAPRVVDIVRAVI